MISMYRFSLLIFLFSKSVSPSGVGKCPKYGYMHEFNTSLFSGNWFEIERSFYMMEITSSCIMMEVFENDKSQLEVTIRTMGRLPFRRTLLEGVAVPTTRDPSLLLLRINSGLPYGLSNVLPGAGFYKILDTDYTNYALIWKCTSFGFFHIDSLWIFGRNTEINAVMRAKIYNGLTDRRIDTERLIIPRNVNCTY